MLLLKRIGIVACAALVLLLAGCEDPDDPSKFGEIPGIDFPGPDIIVIMG